MPRLLLVQLILWRIIAYPAHYKENDISTVFSGPILFLNHHGGPPAYCSLGLGGEPDILAVSGTKDSFKEYEKPGDSQLYSGIPYYMVLSAGECKPGTNPSDSKEMCYIWRNLEPRPDMPGFYGFSANAREYSILWSDPSGPIISPSIPWGNLGPLEQYVHSLYVPPKGHHLVDPSVSSPNRRVPSNSSQKTDEETHWTIVFDGKEYMNCRHIHAGYNWGRRTNVFMYDNPDDSRDFAVIKDAFPDDRKRFKEDVLLNHIHSEGIFPGMVRPLASGKVRGCDDSVITTPSAPAVGKIGRRTKNRLVMGSRGSPLSAAKSVKDILMTVYDGVEGKILLISYFVSTNYNVSLYGQFIVLLS